jgi:hypothetical protein
MLKVWIVSPRDSRPCGGVLPERVKTDAGQKQIVDPLPEWDRHIQQTKTLGGLNAIVVHRAECHVSEPHGVQDAVVGKDMLAYRIATLPQSEELGQSRLDSSNSGTKGDSEMDALTCPFW